MIPQCFLHIGTEKTGTTTIQGFLALNRERLREQGILYPVAPGQESHTALAAVALQRTSIVGKRQKEAIDPARANQFRDDLIAGLDREAGEFRYGKLIFSNEHLSSRVRKQQNVRNIKELCDRYAKTTKVILYLRNQADFLLSSYSTMIKAGASPEFPFPLGQRRLSSMDYDALISVWSEEFGSSNIIVRRFEPQDFVQGDLLTDFAATIPLDMSGLERINRRNEALSAQGLAFLREFNRRIPRFVDGVENLARGNILGALARICAGPRLTIPAAVAETIMKQFSESNRRVSAQYFNGRFDPLFSPPRYVGETDVRLLLSLSRDEVLDIAAKLWADQVTSGPPSGRRRRKRRRSQADEVTNETDDSDSGRTDPA